MNKSKRIAILAVALFLAVSLCSIVLIEHDDTGTVTAAPVGTPISTQADLAAIGMTGQYYLANDITLTGNFTPIGTSSAPFTGTFDGNGCWILGLNVNVSGSSDVDAGLFGAIAAGATIKNVTVMGSVTATSTAGTAIAGGLVGQVNKLNDNTTTPTGAVAISNSCFIGSVTANGKDAYAGGLVGIANQWNSQTTSIFQSYSMDGPISATGTASAYAGGIIGYANTNASEGFLISQSFNEGQVSASAPHASAGGIAGCLLYTNNNYANAILNCYNVGSVSATGANASAGGIVGEIPFYSKVTITNAYSASYKGNGKISATGTDALSGGIIGRVNSVAPAASASIVSSYFLTGTAGAISGSPALTTVDANSRAASDTEMRPALSDATSTIYKGWDFGTAAPNIWTIDTTKNQGYPIFTYSTVQEITGTVYQLNETTKVVGAGIPGVTIAYSGGVGTSTTTDANGNYEIYGRAGASVTVSTVTKTGLALVKVDDSNVPILSDGNIQYVNNPINYRFIGSQHDFVMTSQKLTVTLPADQPDRYTAVQLPTDSPINGVGHVYSVAYGTDFTFAINKDPKYSKNVLTVTVTDAQGSKVIAPNSDGTYTIPGVIVDKTVSVAPNPLVVDSYNITIMKNSDNTFTGANDPSRGSVIPITPMTDRWVGSVELAGGYSFTITLSDNSAYETGAPNVQVFDTVNGQPVTSGTPLTPTYVNGKTYGYTLTDVEIDKLITVDVEKKTYTVELVQSTDNSYTLAPVGTVTSAGAANKYTVTSGDDFTFSVTVASNYNQSVPTISLNGAVPVGAELVLVSQSGNVWTYKIVNIIADKIVSVDNIVENTFKVILYHGAGYTLVPTDAGVTYAGDGVDGVYTVEPGSSFHFKIVVDPSYSRSPYQVLQGGNPANYVNPQKPDQLFYLDSTGIYTLENILENKYITVDGMKLNTYNVYFSPDDVELHFAPYSGDGWTATSTSTLPVPYGGTYTFTIAVDPTYHNTTPQVWVNGTNGNNGDPNGSRELIQPTSANGNTYTYTINFIKEDRVVTVDVVKDKYTVTYLGAGYTVNVPNPSSVDSGTNFPFIVTLLPGYNPSTLVVTSKGDVTPAVVLTGSNGTYTIPNIQENKVVTISVEKLKYVVTFAGPATFSAANPTIVNSGDNLSFTATLNPGYTNMAVTVNGVPITATGGNYNLSNITEDKNVVVTADRLNYLVDFAGPATFSAANPTTVNYGESLSYTVTLNAGYNPATMVVTVNGSPVTATNGTYTISNITENKHVVVTADRLNYIVDFVGPATPSVANPSTVDSGGNISFTVTMNQGYNPATLVVTVNGATLTATNGTYTISNITEDKHVVFTASKLQYTVDFAGPATVSAANPTTVSYGDGLSFTVTLNAGYNPATMVVTVNGTILTANSSGTYNISNITENKHVVITADKLYYIVTFDEFPAGTGYSLPDVPVKSTIVDVGANFTFTVVLAPAYSNSPLAVTSNDVLLAPVSVVAGNDGSVTYSYAINNIHENKLVKVDGVTLNTFKVVAPQVVNGSNVAFVAQYDGTYTGFYADTDNPENQGKTAIVTVNGVVVTNGNSTPGVDVTVNNGVYTINHIKEDKYINVYYELPIPTYTVTLPASGDGYTTTSGSKTVNESGTFTFSVVVDSAHANSTVTVTDNGVALKAKTFANGTYNYVIPNVRTNQTITVALSAGPIVSDPTPTPGTYTVTLPTSPTGYTINTTNASTVASGGSFAFTVNASNPNATIIIKVNGVSVATGKGSCTYTISNITENKTVDVLLTVKGTATISGAPAAGTVTANAAFDEITVDISSGAKYVVISAYFADGSFIGSTSNLNFGSDGKASLYDISFTNGSGAKLVSYVVAFYSDRVTNGGTLLDSTRVTL